MFGRNRNFKRFVLLPIIIFAILFQVNGFLCSNSNNNNRCLSTITQIRTLFFARSLLPENTPNPPQMMPSQRIKHKNVNDSQQPSNLSPNNNSSKWPLTKSKHILTVGKNDYLSRQQTGNKVNIRHDNHLLVLVTTWVPSEDKKFVHDNVARLWGFWPQSVQPILYLSIPKNDKTDSHVIDNDIDTLIKNGWVIRQVPKVLCGNVPVLKAMLLDAMMIFPKAKFYGFANSDIIFDSGLTETLYAVNRLVPAPFPILLLGQRTNLNVTQGIRFPNPDSVRRASKNGVLMKGIAIDYFITNGRFPWREVPDLVIGRIIYDNWMIYFGISQNAIVIDASKTITALHQTTADGNAAGWRYSNRYCNKIIIDKLKKPFVRRWGYTWCVPHKTRWRNNTAIIELKTVSVSPSCNPRRPPLYFPKRINYTDAKPEIKIRLKSTTKKII